MPLEEYPGDEKWDPVQIFSRYLFDRMLLIGFGVVIAVIWGFGFIIYWICRELLLEWDYREKYDSVWRDEFEKYHGSLLHAHTRLAIGVASLIAITAILIWFCRQTFHRKRRAKK